MLRKTTLLLIAVLTISLTNLHAADSDVDTKVKASTVYVRSVLKASGLAMGTGFVVADGVVVTSIGSITGGEPNLGAKQLPIDPLWPVYIEIWISNPKTSAFVKFDGKPLTFDLKNDLAYIEIEKNPNLLKALPPPIRLTPAAKAKLSTPVTVVSITPDHLRPGKRALIKGTLSSLRKNKAGELQFAQIDAELDDKQLAGPVVLENGRAIGLAIARLPDTKIILVQPAEGIYETLKQGKVAEVFILNAAKTEKGYTCDFSVKTVDPLQRIKNLSLVRWKGPRRKAGEPVKPQKGDSKRRRIELKLDDGYWMGKLSKAMTLSDNEEFFAYIVTKAGGKTVSLTDPSLYHIRENAADKTIASRAPKPPTVEIFTPPADVPRLPVKIEKDKSGSSVEVVTSTPRKIELDMDIADFACALSGAEVYLIFKGRQWISVRNPLTLKETEKITLPSEAKDLWCDDKLIIAMCPYSQEIVQIDLKTRRQRTIKVKHEWLPTYFCARSPQDGYLIKVTNKDQVAFTKLVHVDKDGNTKELNQPFKDCLYLPDGTGLLERDARQNIPLLYRFSATGGLVLDENSQSNILHREGRIRGGYCMFPASDGESIVIPARHMEQTFRPWTYVVDGNLDRVKMQFEGSTIAEVPAQNMYVSWDEPKRGGEKVIYYIDNKTGRIMRRVNVAKNEEVNTSWSLDFLDGFVYVPGYELLYRWMRHSPRREVIQVPCGPITKPGAMASNKKPVPVIGDTTPAPTVELAPEHVKELNDARLALPLYEDSGPEPREVGSAWRKNSFLLGGDMVIAQASEIGLSQKSLGFEFSGKLNRQHNPEQKFKLKFMGCDPVNDIAYLKILSREPKGVAATPTLKLAINPNLKKANPLGLVIPEDSDGMVVGSLDTVKMEWTSDGVLKPRQFRIEPGNTRSGTDRAALLADGKGEIHGICMGRRLGREVISSATITRVLEHGTVGSVGFEPEAGGTGYQVKASLVDPMGVVDKLYFVYWVGPEDCERTRDPETGYLAHGVAGDQKKDACLFERQENGTWIAKPKVMETPDGMCVWYQIATRPKGLPVYLLEATVNPLTARKKDDDAGTIKTVQDEHPDGTPFRRGITIPTAVTLPLPLLEIVAPPSGKEFYAIFRDKAKVYVLDPRDLKKVAEIPCPKYPDTISCTEDRIMITSIKSRVVGLIDSKTRRPLKAFKLKGQSDHYPASITSVGKGVYYGTWLNQEALKASGRHGDGYICELREDGSMKKLNKKPARSICDVFPLKGSPYYMTFAGGVDLRIWATGQNVDTQGLKAPLQYIDSGIGRSNVPFFTSDGSGIVLSGYNSSIQRDETRIISLDGERFLAEFPGYTVGENPDQNALVCRFFRWDNPKSRWPAFKLRQIGYVNKDSGKIIRLIDMPESPEVGQGLWKDRESLGLSTSPKATVFSAKYELFYSFKSRSYDKYETTSKGWRVVTGPISE